MILITGVNLLLLSFPMMLIAALSCVYLHFQKQSNRSYSNSTILYKQTKKNSIYSSSSSLLWTGCSSVITTSRLTFWRRPAVVKAPLGIVTAMELAFAIMFAALLVWSLANYLYVSFGHLHMHKDGEKVYEFNIIPVYTCCYWLNISTGHRIFSTY